MKPKLFLKKKEKSKQFLAIDIGAQTLKALIFSTPDGREVKRKQNKKIIIEGVSTQYFDEFGIFDTTEFEEGVLKRTLLKALKEIQAKIKIKTNTLFLGLPANILRGRVIGERFERKKPKEVINETERNQIQKTIFDKVKANLSQEFAKLLSLLPQDFVFYNLKTLEAKIDGYEVPSISGLNGKNLEFRILATFLQKYYLEKIKKIFQGFNLKIEKLIHEAENLPFLFQENKKDALFVDVGGGLTKILLTEKGKLKEISEFEKGGIDFTRVLSQVLGLNLQRARVLKHNYSQFQLSAEMRKRIKKIFSGITQDWFLVLKKNLKNLPKKLLPANIFLFGGGSLLPEISEILKTGDWSDFPLVGKPKVEPLYPKNLKNIEVKIKGLNSPQQISLLLISYDGTKKNF